MVETRCDSALASAFVNVRTFLDPMRPEIHNVQLNAWTMHHRGTTTHAEPHVKHNEFHAGFVLPSRAGGVAAGIARGSHKTRSRKSREAVAPTQRPVARSLRSGQGPFPLEERAPRGRSCKRCSTTRLLPFFLDAFAQQSLDVFVSPPEAAEACCSTFFVTVLALDAVCVCRGTP